MNIHIRTGSVVRVDMNGHKFYGTVTGYREDGTIFVARENDTTGRDARIDEEQIVRVVRF